MSIVGSRENDRWEMKVLGIERVWRHTLEDVQAKTTKGRAPC